jgi:hypothetical protein
MKSSWHPHGKGPACVTMWTELPFATSCPAAGRERIGYGFRARRAQPSLRRLRKLSRAIGAFTRVLTRYGPGMTASGAMIEPQQDTEAQSPWRRMFLRSGRNYGRHVSHVIRDMRKVSP